MKVRQLLHLLSREDEEATVRVTTQGERPQLVKAVAHAGDNIVVMAVPEWNFDEISDALALVPAGPVLLPWDDIYVKKESNGDTQWYCRLHGKQDCADCKALREPGWHWGITSNTRFCNGHSVRDCRTCAPDRWKEVGS